MYFHVKIWHFAGVVWGARRGSTNERSLFFVFKIFGWKYFFHSGLSVKSAEEDVPRLCARPHMPLVGAVGRGPQPILSKQDDHHRHPHHGSVTDHNIFRPSFIIIANNSMASLMYQAKIPSFSSQQCPLSRSSQMTTKQNKVGQKKLQIAFWDVTWC